MLLSDRLAVDHAPVPDAVRAVLCLVKAQWNASPAPALPGVETQRQLTYFLRQTRRIIENPEANLFVAGGARSDAGASCWSPLPWDSKMFGFSAARLDFVVAKEDGARLTLLNSALSSARNRGVRHMIARADVRELSLARTLVACGFEIIDGIQTFHLNVADAVSPSSAKVETRHFIPKDLQEILQLARTAYTLDRFHADDAINPEIAGRVNEEWLRNSCSGQVADAVVVAVDGTEVLGYATCKIDRESGPGLGLAIGTIVMVATAQHARRRGVAAACTHAAIAYFQQHHIDLIQVGTQLRNVPAARLYEGCGFRMASNSLTWRIRL